MWIRTQDKEALVYANNFCIMKTRGEEKYEISYFDGDSFVKLGFYKSKERALEVLDEMQSYLENNYLSISDMPQHNNNPWIDYCPRYITRTTKTVYQMPKEWLNDRKKIKRKDNKWKRKSTR